MTATAPTIAEQIVAMERQKRLRIHLLDDDGTMLDAILATLRSVEALQRDAARYRWLEANANKGIGSEWADYTFRIPEGCSYRHSLKEMIDAAIESKARGELRNAISDNSHVCGCDCMECRPWTT
jgi:hypothetical protein